MSTSNVNNAAAPRQVACETADNDQVPVELDVLRVSGTFKRMCADLGLEEHDVFPGVFPVTTIGTRIFKKVIDWCSEDKGEPEPVIEKDPLTQECKWFTLTYFEHRFFDVTMSTLLELAIAADYLDIPRLYHYACQSIAARIKGQQPDDVCGLLQQECDLDDAQIRKALEDNPWLEPLDAFSGAPVEDAIFIPDDVLVTIFEKLPRADLDRLRLVSTQFSNVIESSSALSQRQGPLRVVAKVEFGAFFDGSSFSQRTRVELRVGTSFTSTDSKDLAKRLKFATIQQFQWDATTRWFVSGNQSDAYMQSLSALLPVKSAWKNATLKASVGCFPPTAFEFVFTRLLLCKEIALVREYNVFALTPLFLRLTAIAACNKLDISKSNLFGDFIPPTDVVEWLQREVPPEKQWTEPRQMILREDAISGGTDGLLTALKQAFAESTSGKPYALRIQRGWRRDDVDQVLANETTHEALIIRAEQNGDVSVKRA